MTDKQGRATTHYVQKLRELVERKDLRSADRANMVTMLAQLKKGRPLDYQQRQNLWAYFNRYGVPVVVRGRP
jgi:hypothetical protein